MLKEKAINAMLYAIEKYPEIGRTKLMKFFFLADLIHYNEKGEPLLENEYIRMPRGPVPETPLRLTETSNSFLEVCPMQIDPEWTIFHFNVKKHADVSLFSEEEISLFDELIPILKYYTAEQISEITHQFSLWKKVANGDIIPIESFKLDEYESIGLGSLLSFHNARNLADQVEIDEDNFSEEVPEDFFVAQMVTMDSV